MAYRHIDDLALTDTGDLALLPSGDLELASRSDDPVGKALTDQLAIRLLTPIGKWAEYPPLGSRLEDLVGRPNTPELARAAEQTVRSALTFDGRFASDEIDVAVLPIQNLLMLHLSITLQGTVRRFLLTLDVRSGIRLEAVA